MTWKDFFVSKLEAETEPLWRVAAYWMVIIVFFSLPILIFIIQLTVKFSPLLNPDLQQGEFRYLTDFHRVLAAMLIAMLGLNSWDKRLIAKNGHGNGVEKKIGGNVECH